MQTAYLQNKKAQYYYIADDGRVSLTNARKPLQLLPEPMESADELVSLHKDFDKFTKTGFIFRNDGLRILSDIFFRKGADADCILTIGPENNICGDLDFSTARIISSKKEIRICCVHF